MDAFVSSFILVALSEMGDKTQLLAFSLAVRFNRPWTILLSIFVATFLNHTLASQFGSWIATYFSAQLLAILLAVAFIGFGFWTLKPDNTDESNSARYSSFFTTTALFFLAEMGDKTQLATVALAAKYQSTLWVTLGTTLGTVASDGIAVFLGDKFSGCINMKWVRWSAASLFFGFGVICIASALRIL